MTTPLDRMIDEACRCKTCHALPLECRCKKTCWCGERYLADQPEVHRGYGPHVTAVSVIHAKFPKGKRVRYIGGGGRVYGETATVVGYSRFPIDNWLRVKYDTLAGVVREPESYFEVKESQ